MLRELESISFLGTYNAVTLATIQPRRAPIPQKPAAAYSWVIGSVLLIAAVAFLYGLSLTSTTLYYARLSENLFALLNSGVKAQYIVSRPEYSEILSPKRRDIQKLIELSDAIKEQRIADAHEIAKQDARELDLEISAGLEQLTAILESQKPLAIERQVLEGEASSLEERYAELFRSTRAALRLSLGEADQNYGEYYDSGIMLGLPRLQEIPAGVQSIDELTELLKRINGASTSPTSVEILTAVQPLRELAAALRTADTQLSTREETLTSKEEDLTSQFEQVQEEVLTSVHKALIARQEIPVDDRSRALYAIVRPYIEKVGLSAPALPSASATEEPN